LKNAVLRVKGVPLLYVPVMYYPLGEDGRSTGFLLPTYKTTTISGWGISNAFFWAINRSQDATFYHDWTSKAGQGMGTEYRFVSAPGSSGRGKLYMIDENERIAEDGSVATWIDEVFVNSSQLYYPKGALTGMLLDIAIRDATNNVNSLDEVMRALYARHYQKGKGFGTEDVLALLREFGMPDVDTFYQRYINGRDPLPYDAILPKAGISVAKTITSVPFLGVVAPPSDDGRWVVQLVEPGSAAHVAGVTPGDELVKIGEIDAQGAPDWSAAFRRRYQGQAGAPLTITVQRNNQTVALTTKVQEHTSTAFSLSRNATPTPKQAKIWQGLATGSIGG